MLFYCSDRLNFRRKLAKKLDTVTLHLRSLQLVNIIFTNDIRYKPSRPRNMAREGRGLRHQVLIDESPNPFHLKAEVALCFMPLVMRYLFG